MPFRFQDTGLQTILPITADQSGSPGAFKVWFASRGTHSAGHFSVAGYGWMHLCVTNDLAGCQLNMSQTWSTSTGFKIEALSLSETGVPQKLMFDRHCPNGNFCFGVSHPFSDTPISSNINPHYIQLYPDRVLHYNINITRELRLLHVSAIPRPIPSLFSSLGLCLTSFDAEQMLICCSNRQWIILLRTI